VITIHREPYCNRIITRFRASERPDMALFSDAERSIVDWWIKDAAHSTSKQCDEDDEDYAWNIAAEGEEIPMYAIFAERICAPRGEELEWAKTEAERLGLS